MNAIAPPPRKGPIPVWSIRPDQRTRGGGSRRGRGLNGYAVMQLNRGTWRGRWRWRLDTVWRSGSVRTEEEAREWVELARAAIAIGEEPPELPHYDAREDRDPPPAPAPTLPPEEIAARRARIKQQMAPDAPRCPHCHCLTPCDPCIPEIRREIRNARRGEP